MRVCKLMLKHVAQNNKMLSRYRSDVSYYSVICFVYHSGMAHPNILLLVLDYRENKLSGTLDL